MKPSTLKSGPYKGRLEREVEAGRSDSRLARVASPPSSESFAASRNRIVTHARVCYNHDGIGETVGGEFPPGLIENCTEGGSGSPQLGGSPLG